MMGGTACPAAHCCRRADKSAIFRRIQRAARGHKECRTLLYNAETAALRPAAAKQSNKNRSIRMNQCTEVNTIKINQCGIVNELDLNELDLVQQAIATRAGTRALHTHHFVHIRMQLLRLASKSGFDVFVGCVIPDTQDGIVAGLLHDGCRNGSRRSSPHRAMTMVPAAKKPPYFCSICARPQKQSRCGTAGRS